jgi:hypothetical protein
MDSHQLTRSGARAPAGHPAGEPTGRRTPTARRTAVMPRCLKVSFAVVATTALLAPPLAAQGASGLEFLTVPNGARPLALGEAYAALASGVDGIAYNPAGLARLDGFGASASHMEVRDFYRQSLLVSGLPTASGGVALSLAVQRFDAIPLTDEQGRQHGEFAPQTLILAASYARRLGAGIDAGISAKGFVSELTHGAGDALGPQFSGETRGVALDVGVAVRPLPGLPARFGLALTDVGPEVRYNDTPDALPTRLRGGLAVRPLDLLPHGGVLPVTLLLSGDAVSWLRETERTVEFGYGAEVTLAGIVGLRAGLPARPHRDEDRPAWLGLGFRYGGVALDLARRVSEHPALGEEMHLSVAVTF